MIKYIWNLICNLFIKVKEYMAKLYLGDKRVKGVGVGSNYVSFVSGVRATGLHVTITSGTTSIASSAFNGAHLSAVTIPSSVTTINSFAFYFCSLKEVYFAGNPPTVNSSSFGGNSNVKMYHKANNTNWTSSIKTSNYGGASNVTWGTY